MGGCSSKKVREVVIESFPIPNINQYNLALDRWTQNQLQLIKSNYQKLACSQGIRRKDFLKVFPALKYCSNQTIQNCFDKFDIDGKQFINFRSLCIMLSKILCGSLSEIIQFIFSVFSIRDAMDIDNFYQFVNFYQNGSKFLKQDPGSDFKQMSPFKTQQHIQFNEFHLWFEQMINVEIIIQLFEFIPTQAGERRIVRHYQQNKQYLDQKERYLISIQWWQRWCKYTRYEEDELKNYEINRNHNPKLRPLSIDNESLLIDKHELQADLVENQDFVAIVKQTWQDLLKWYGGGPVIIRRYDLDNQQVVLYPAIVFVQLKSFRNIVEKEKTILLYNDDVIQTKLNQICDKWQIKDNVKIYLLQNDQSITFDINQTVEEIGIQNRSIIQLRQYSASLSRIAFNEGDHVIVDKNKDGNWETGIIMKVQLRKVLVKLLDQSTLLIEKTSQYIAPSQKTIRMVHPGIGKIGLTNLGNSCYINSVVQCLSNTPLIKDFLIQNNLQAYQQQSNQDQFQLINNFAQVLKRIWEGKETKKHIQKFNQQLFKAFPYFTENEQHDSHEFLSILLDNLHECFLRSEQAVKLSIIENGTEEEEVAQANNLWESLQGEKGSVISDMCGGITRTVLTCDNCQSRKTIFELFTNLSLPIPAEYDIVVYVTYVPIKGNLIKLGYTFSSFNTVGNVLDKISESVQIQKQFLRLVEVKNNRITAILSNAQQSLLKNVGVKSGQQLAAYQMPYYKQNRVRSMSENQSIDNLQGDTVDSTRMDSKNKEMWIIFEIPHTVINSTGQTQEVVGFPLYLSFGIESKLKDLHYQVNKRISQFQQDRLPLIKRGEQSKNHKKFEQLANLVILDPSCKKCGLCKKNCMGCELSKGNGLLKSLRERLHNLVIVLQWQYGYFIQNIAETKEYLEAQQKENNIKGEVKLSECFDTFTNSEKVENTCERCQNKHMTIQLEVWKVPDILILCLKRFTFQQGILDKIDSSVEISQNEFDISKWIKAPFQQELENKALSTYNLYGIVCHTGSLQSGHYTSYCYQDSQWILFDDNYLMQVDFLPSSIGQNAYLLFFKRKELSSSNIVNISRDAFN